MYNVSEKYREAISRNVREYYITGELITETGRIIPVNHDTLYEKSPLSASCQNKIPQMWMPLLLNPAISSSVRLSVFPMQDEHRRAGSRLYTGTACKRYERHYI